MKSGRNIDKHTDAATVEANIVAHMRKWRCDRRHPLMLSTLGEVGFQGYRFGRPQGAALAVSRIVRGMLNRGVLRLSPDGYGYYLTELG